MSAQPNDEVHSLLNRRRELVEKAQTQALSEAEQADLLAELESILEKLEPTLRAQMDFMAIHFRLMDRQGTIEPNFQALYKKKAKLDKKLFGA